MIQSYQFHLSVPQPFSAAYPLYAAVLEYAPQDFASRLHDSAATPVSQYIHNDTWQISLFGPEAIRNLGPVLDNLSQVDLRRDRVHLDLQLRDVRRICSVESLLDSPVMDRGEIRMLTPTAFKSKGAYQLLPTQRLVMQNLILKWNGYFGDICPIEDEGGGLDTLAEGLRYRSVHLDSCIYSMKQTQIPGVLGTVAFDNRLEGFHRQLANALLTFGSFSGLGIKTALGMGGLKINTK